MNQTEISSEQNEGLRVSKLTAVSYYTVYLLVYVVMMFRRFFPYISRNVASLRFDIVC